MADREEATAAGPGAAPPHPRHAARLGDRLEVDLAEIRVRDAEAGGPDHGLERRLVDRAARRSRSISSAVLTMRISRNRSKASTNRPGGGPPSARPRPGRDVHLVQTDVASLQAPVPHGASHRLDQARGPRPLHQVEESPLQLVEGRPSPCDT